MADKKDSLVFKAEVEGGESLTTLKKQYKEIQQELDNTIKGTEAYNKTLQRLGEIKDNIGDLRDTINALNPEGKIAAFANVAGKLAGGFQAATGAAALFGVKTDEIEKQLLKVQAATAFAEGIQSVIGLGDAFAVLAEVIEANPIFLVAAALIAVTIAVVSFTKEEEKAIEKIEDFNKALDDQNKLFDENSRKIDVNNQLIIESLKQRGASEKQISEEVVKQNSEKLERLKEQERKATDERVKFLDYVREKTFLLEYDGNTEQIELNKKKLEALNKAEAEAIKARVEFEGSASIELAKIKTKEFLDAQAEAKKAAEEAKRASEARIKNMQDMLASNLKSQEDYDAFIAEEKRKAHEQELKDFEDNKIKEQKIEDDYRAYEDKKFKDQLAENRKLDAQASADAVILKQQETNAKQEIATQSLNALKGLSDAYYASLLDNTTKGSKAEIEIKKKQFNVNKAFAIADAVLNGIRGVQAAIGSAPPPYNFVLAAITGLVAAANIAKIASTKFDAGSSTPSIGSTGSAPAPNIPQPGTGQISLNGADRSGRGNQSVVISEAFVIESKMSEAQLRSQRIQRQGKF